jgi:patatin-like phospholipase/acyl hydrolase
MAKYKILSLDGGGLRGLITARLLHRLNSHPSIAGWLADVDLYVGTSTGGILALGLAAGKSPLKKWLHFTRAKRSGYLTPKWLSSLFAQSFDRRRFQAAGQAPFAVLHPLQIVAEGGRFQAGLNQGRC